MCKDQLWQARLEKNVFNLGSVNKAVTVSVGPCKHLVILNFLGCRHNPLATRHLTSKQEAIIINHTKPFSRKKQTIDSQSPLHLFCYVFPNKTLWANCTLQYAKCLLMYQHLQPCKRFKPKAAIRFKHTRKTTSHKLQVPLIHSNL